MAYFIIDNSAQRHYANAMRAVLSCTEDARQAEAFLIFGGDGAMLHAINRYHSLQKPFIGVNTGTRGYLMNNTEQPGEFYRNLDNIVIQPLWMLEADIETDRENLRVYAFNDIWVERHTNQTLRMVLTIDKVTQPSLLIGDGILFCTPQGSTGYNLSLRGKAIAPGVPVLQVTPMSCVVNKSPLGSIILSDSSQVEVEFQQPEKRPGAINYDGFDRDHGTVRTLKVRKSDTTVQLGLVKDYSFLHKVLSWQLKF